MPIAWPIIKFLFQVVGPSIPEIISTISKIRNPEGEQESQEKQEEDLERRIKELDRRLSLQLDLIDTLSKQILSLQLLIRRALMIGIVALALSLIIMAWLILAR